MVWKVNNFLLRGSLEVILAFICDIHNTNGEVVCGINFNNHPGYGCCYYCRGGLVKVNYFHLRSTIGTMAWSVVVDVVKYIIGDCGYNRSEDVGCDG